MPRKKFRGDLLVTGNLNVGKALTPALGVEYADNAFTIKNADTATKKLAFSAAGIGANQKRVLTAPNYNGTIATVSGVEALENKTLDVSNTLDGTIITNGLADENGEMLIAVAAADTPVNYIKVTNAATLSGPIIEAAGEDADVDLNLAGQGDGKVVLDSDTQVTGDLLVANIEATGAGADVDLTLAGKGAGVVQVADLSPVGTMAVADDVLVLLNAAKPTKQAAFDCSGITEAATRTLTIPNADGTIVLEDAAQALEEKTLDDSCTLDGTMIANGLSDEAGLPLIAVVPIAVAVNCLEVTNAATGNSPKLAAIATDVDPDVALTLAGLGTGAVILGQATSEGVQLAANQPILDAAGKELLAFVATADAVNEVTITNKDTGQSPEIAASGGDNDIPLTVTGKGTGAVILGQAGSAGVCLADSQPILDEHGKALLAFGSTDNAVNEITVTNNATGESPILAASGTDPDVALTLAGQGTGAVILGQATSEGVQFADSQPILDERGKKVLAFSSMLDAVNEITVGNSAAGESPEVAATGNDPDISVVLTPQGDGKVVAKNRIADFMVATINSEAQGIAYTPAQILGGIILRDPDGNHREDKLPTAADLVAAIPGCVVGTAFEFTLRNTADAAETITVDVPVAGGVTISGTPTIEKDYSRRWLVVITDVTPQSEAYTAYSLGTSLF